MRGSIAERIPLKALAYAHSAVASYMIFLCFLGRENMNFSGAHQRVKAVAGREENIFFMFSKWVFNICHDMTHVSELLRT